MSVRATSWAWEKGREGLAKDGELLTLLRVADHADNDGICWPGQKSVAEYTGQGERTIRRHLGDLEERGLLTREKQQAAKGRGRAFDRILLALDQADNLAGRSETTNRPPETDQPATRGQGTNKGTVKNRHKVNRKTVSESESTLAAAVVSSFNEIAGTRLSADAHLVPVVGRIREHPKLNAGHHRKVIEAVFAGNHWWDDPAGIQVVYGNAAIFEKSIELARAAAKKKSTPVFDVNAEAKRIRKAQGL
jgi:Helix-turn-helix domain